MTIPFDYSQYDALDLAGLIRKGDVTAAEVLEQAITRADAVNPKINAIVYFMREEARKVARSPQPGTFYGVPFLLKDVYAAYRGFPMSHGSRLLKDFVPDWNDDVTARYVQAGLVVFGKTNTSEFGILPTTEPDVFEPARNPWDPGRTPGGSSGGAAAAVSSGIVPIAHGSDGGGSIRIPASCCGVFGFKTSRGLSPSGPKASELFFGYGSQHVISRTVRDSAAALDVIAQPKSIARLQTESFHQIVAREQILVASNRPRRALRIAWSKTPYVAVDVDSDCIIAVCSTAKFCQQLGHEVEEAAPEIDGEQFARDFFVVTCAGALMALTFWQKHLGRTISRPEIETVTQLCRIIASNFSAGEFLAARDRLMSIQRKVEAFLEKYDAILTPTLASLPPRLGQFRPPPIVADILDVSFRWPFRLVYGCKWVVEQIIRRFPDLVYRFTPFAQLANIAGLPSMSVPMSTNSQGLPVGTMFTAGLARDAVLFELASQLELLPSWQRSRPNL